MKNNMNTMFIQLRRDDEVKAKEFMFKSIGTCATHTLSKKLLEYFGPTSKEGTIRVIFYDWKHLRDISSVDYRHSNSVEISKGIRPLERLSMFVSEYLLSVPHSIVICENWVAKRHTYADWDEEVPPPPFSCLGENEVYHILSHPSDDLDAIEDVVSPSAHWQTGVCSVCENVPDGDIPDASFLEDIVINARHVFVTAFDNTGFLIWSPTRENEVKY